MSWWAGALCSASPMDDATGHGTGDIATQSDCVLAEETADTAYGTSCLCCSSLTPPVITLATACVHYLRCATCGFIWIVRAPEPVVADAKR